ncbi:MAG TPA: hypothetical protein VG477_14865, partial [Thermoanaerobaculia bacterium]|nr:hypothetical protein [Thermoanaerobaculia bacterium]
MTGPLPTLTTSVSQLHALRRWVPLALLAAALGCGKAQDAKEVVVPVATPEAIALIQDNADRCAKLGESGLAVLQSAEKVQAAWNLTANARRNLKPEDGIEMREPE